MPNFHTGPAHRLTTEKLSLTSAQPTAQGNKFLAP